MSMHGLAEQIRDAVLADLLGRKGFDWAWDDIDPDIQEEIRAQVLSIVSSHLGADVPGGPVLSPWAQGMRAMLGKQVRVTISREPELVERTGKLQGFSDDGEVMLWDGIEMWHLWPNLECREERPGG